MLRSLLNPGALVCRLVGMDERKEHTVILRMFANSVVLTLLISGLAWYFYS